MSTPLIVTNVTPVDLSGLVNEAKELQIQHSSACLSDHGQQLNAEHRDLNAPTGTVRIKIEDFASQGENWQISVSHQESGVPSTWPRNGNHAYHDFNAMTDALEVDVVATSTGSPSASKTRKIWIKTTSVDGQPDRP
ncbi:MAG: hypothetical protein AAF799_29795 [Myxococcota bacterium]